MHFAWTLFNLYLSKQFENDTFHQICSAVLSPDLHCGKIKSLWLWAERWMGPALAQPDWTWWRDRPTGRFDRSKVRFKRFTFSSSFSHRILSLSCNEWTYWAFQKCRGESFPQVRTSQQLQMGFVGPWHLWPALWCKYDCLNVSHRLVGHYHLMFSEQLIMIIHHRDDS